MRISNDGIALIKRFEGLELEAYRDAVGILTIGYGHTGDDVYEGQVITEAEAEAILRRDLDRFEVAVNEGIKSKTAQSMFDAFVSLSFNIGANAFKKSTALKRHNKKDYTGAAEAITWWNKAGGQVLGGLVRRRAAEEALYLEGLDEVGEDIDHASNEIEENTPRRNNPVTSRTTAGAGTAGVAGATGAGAVLLDDDGEQGTETTDSGSTETPAGDTGETPADTDMGTDTGETPETGTDVPSSDTDQPPAGDTDADLPAGDVDTDTDSGTGETEDTGEDAPGDTGEDQGEDSSEDTSTTGTTEGTVAKDGGLMEDFTKEDKTDAIVILAGIIAVIAAVYVIGARIDDWFKYRR